MFKSVDLMEFIEAESRTMATRVEEVGEIGKYRPKSTNHILCDFIYMRFKNM